MIILKVDRVKLITPKFEKDLPCLSSVKSTAEKTNIKELCSF